MQLTPSPVKVFSLTQGLRVISPESVNKEPLLQEIKSWGAEVAVVVAFGQILSQSFLDLFPRGAVNIHGSILPRWRGAAPIQRAIEAGDQETGVTLQKIVKELDAGDIIGLRRTAIKNDQHAMQLHDELAQLGADLLHVELMDYVRGNLAPVPQDPAGVTYAKKIDKAESEIHWSHSAERIVNKTRAFVMGPGVFTFFKGKKMKIHAAQVIGGADPRFQSLKWQQAQSGQVVAAGSDHLIVKASEGAVSLLEVQPESRNRQNILDFQKAQSVREGDFFGSR